MVMKRITLVVVVLTIFLFAYPSFQSYSADTGEDKGTAPVIVDSYATNVVRPGRTWNIYLRANDDDGDMRDIFTVFMKRGSTPFLTSVTRIDNQSRKDLAGYLFLQIPAQSELLLQHFTFQVSVRDDKGNVSEAILFPLRFDYVSTSTTPEAWKELAHRPLGPIWIDLDGLIRKKYLKE